MRFSLLSKMSYKTATQFHDKIKTFALYILENQISMVTRMRQSSMICKFIEEWDKIPSIIGILKDETKFHH